MNQQDRPARITTILQTLGSDYSEDMKTILETYIADLENSHQTAAPDHRQPMVWDRDNPPVWSHQRSVERDQHRWERNLKKRNHYQ